MNGFVFFLITGPDQTAPLALISWICLVYQQKCRDLTFGLLQAQLSFCCKTWPSVSFTSSVHVRNMTIVRRPVEQEMKRKSVGIFSKPVWSELIL